MKVITIGRSSENDVIINDIKVSRHHLQIIQDDYGSFRLCDFGSANGTFVNGRKISGEIMLSKNDIIRIGNTTLAWKEYFPNQPASIFTPAQAVPSPVPASISAQSTNQKSKKNADVDYYEKKDINIDYNEGGFGRKFGQAAGDTSGNIVGCFIGIVIVIVLIVMIGFFAF